MTNAQEDDPKEVEARMAAALKRALSTPPKPHKKQARGGSGDAKTSIPRRDDSR